MPYTYAVPGSNIKINNIPDDITIDSDALARRVLDAVGKAEQMPGLEISDQQEFLSHNLGLQNKILDLQGASKQQNDELTLQGAGAAATRGIAPTLAGAAIGFPLGGPVGAAAGAAAANIAPLLGDPIVDSINGIFGTQFSKQNEAMEALLTQLGVPEAKNESEKIIKSAVEGGASSVGLSGLGGFLSALKGSPVIAGIGRTLSQAPAQDAVAGAVAGGGYQAIDPEHDSVASAIGASLLGSAAGGLTQPKNAINSVRNLVPEAPKEGGVSILRSDINPPKTFLGKSAQSLGEKIPFTGTGGLRSNQQMEREGAAEKLVDRFLIKPQTAGDNTVIDQKTMNSYDLYRDSAENIKNNLESITKNRAVSKSKFIAGVSEDLQKSGYKIEAPNTLQALDQSIKELKAVGSPVAKKAANTFAQYTDAIKNPNLSLTTLNDIRKDFGSLLENLDNKDIKSFSDKKVSSIYHAFNKDLESAISVSGQSPRRAEQWKALNADIADLIEFKKNNRPLANALRGGDYADRKIALLLKSETPEHLKATFGLLDKSGKELFKSAVIKDAMEKSMKEDVLDPDKLSKNLMASANKIGLAFNKADRDYIDGFNRVIQLTRRARDASVTPPTGIQNLVPIMGISLYNSLGAIASLGGASLVGLGARLYENQSTRNLLQRFSKSGVESKEGRSHLTSILKNIHNMKALEERAQEETTGAE